MTATASSLRGAMRIALFALTLVLWLWLLLARGAPAAAAGVVGTGTPQSCTSQALADALSAGGLVTFNCGAAPATIVITQSGGIAIAGQAVTLDGGTRVTLSGGDTQRVFLLSSGALTLTNLIVAHGHAPADDGGCILDVSTGPLLLNNVTVQVCSVDSGYRGGGIESFFGPVTLVNSQVVNGAAYYGGGIYKAYDALTLVNSRVDASFASSGGGIYVVGALSLVNADIANNIAITNGGGIDLEGGAAFIDHSRIYSNTTQAGDGGGLRIVASAQASISASTIDRNTAFYSGGGIVNSGILTATQTSLEGNTADGGGGILNDQGTATLSSVILSGNSAADGSGINNFQGTLTLTNSTLGGNSGVARGESLPKGGGIVNSGSTLLTNVTLSGNSANAGGGIWNVGSTLTLSNSTLSGNSAGDGGGILNYAGTATLTDVTLSGNSVSVAGGGIYNYATATLSNVTLSGNSATNGGGIFHVGNDASHTISLRNTIVANSPSGGNCYRDPLSVSGSTIVSLGYNVASDRSCQSFFNQPGDLPPGTDPNLLPLANYGGPTQTQMPKSPSQAIDAIPFGTNGCGTTLTTDQRGGPRPINGKCDVGAVEYGATFPWLWLPLIAR